jgi:integrase
MAIFQPKYTDKKTGETKTSAVWWYEFVYASKRYRESAKTTRKTLAENREKNRRLEVERQFTTGARPADPRLMLRTVKEAIDTYIARYDAPNHAERSIEWVKQRCPDVVRILGATSLLDIDEERVIAYMRTRRDEGAGNRIINVELLCLSRAIGSTWAKLWPNVPKLVEPSDVGRALSPEEEGRLLGAAMKNKSPYIVPFIHVALCTGMRHGEIRTLQLERLDLAKRELRVGGSKSEAGRGRGIPMNDDLYQAIAGQVEWLKKEFGAPRPEWYLFPFCQVVKPIDPTRPVTTIKTAWESVRAVAGVKCRFHDLRHTAATKMAENNTSEETMKALLGHMSKKMIERYSHIRDAAKRRATKGLSLAKPIHVMPESGAKNGVPQVSPKVKMIRRKTGS